MRIYLSKNGSVRIPTADENSHYGIAKTILNVAGGMDADDAYSEMWKLGWVRVVDLGDRVYAEKYLDGMPVPFMNLPRAQREWLEDQALSGKILYWNNKVFESTREGKPNAHQIVQTLIGPDSIKDV